MTALLNNLSVMTLFVEDLDAAKRFYQEVFGLPLVFEDDNSAVANLGNTLINLLKISEAPELVAPATVGSREAGSRLLLESGKLEPRRRSVVTSELHHSIIGRDRPARSDWTRRVCHWHRSP